MQDSRRVLEPCSGWTISLARFTVAGGADYGVDLGTIGSAGIVSSDGVRHCGGIFRNAMIVHVLPLLHTMLIGVLIFGRAIWTVALGVILLALSSGTLLTTLAALTGDLAASDRQGLAIGRLATAGDLGSAMGPLLAYTLLSLISLRWIYLLCGLTFASSLLALRHAVAGHES